MARRKSSMSDYSNMSIFKIFKQTKISERTPTEKLPPKEINSKNNQKRKN